MGRKDKQNGEGQEIELIPLPYFLDDQEAHPGDKEQPGLQTVMMATESMPKCLSTNEKSKTDHPILESPVQNPQNRQRSYRQRQHRTVDGTKDRCRNAQSVPIDFVSHERQSYGKRNIVAN